MLSKSTHPLFIGYQPSLIFSIIQYFPIFVFRFLNMGFWFGLFWSCYWQWLRPIRIILFIQYFKLMKSKINRKLMKQHYPPLANCALDTPQLTNIKFQISKDNISCFIGKNKTSKKVCRKTSQSSAKSQKQSSRPKSSLPKKVAVVAQQKEERKKQVSPDIIRQSSNTILSKIQEKGIMCAWNQAEEQNETPDEGQDNSDNVTIWSAFENQTEKSFASTNDYPYYHTVNLTWSVQNDQTQHYINPMANSFIVQPELIQHDWRTTLMIRNIPNKYTVSQLADQIDSQHANTYDFLYLPCDPKNLCNVGYGFINFVHTAHLKTFYAKYNKYIWQKYKSEKICALTYARLQGLNQLIEHFQNSKVLNQKEKKYRPIIKLDKIQKIVMEQQGR